MKNNKKLNWLAGFVAVALIGLTLFAIKKYKEIRKTPNQQFIESDAYALSPPQFKQITENKPASRLTDVERQTLRELFAERFKPVIDRWANAYSNRIPFDVSEITLDKFHSTSNGNYTFMIGDTTFVIFNGINGAKVFYMMTRQGAKNLNSVPDDGQPRSLTVPITKDEALKMAEADTGLHYELKDIVIKPTATFCNIDGGAMVEVGIKYKNGMMLLNPDNLGFVIGKDGKLVTYQH
jgi:hypothetical protein